MSHLTYKVRMRQYFEFKKQHMEKTTPTSEMSDSETEETYGRSFGGQYNNNNNNNKEQLKSTNNDDDGEWDDGETTTPAQVLTRQVQKQRPFLTIKIPNTYDMNVALKFSQEVFPKLANAPYIDVLCIHKYFLKVYEHYLDILENKPSTSASAAAVTHACDAYFKEIIKLTEQPTNQTVKNTTTECVQWENFSRPSLPSVKSLLQNIVPATTTTTTTTTTTITTTTTTGAIPKIVNEQSRTSVFAHRKKTSEIPASAPFKKLKIKKIPPISTPNDATLYANLHHMSYTAMEKLDRSPLSGCTSNKKENTSGSAGALREKPDSLDSIVAMLRKNRISKQNSNRASISYDNQRSVNITEQSRPQLQTIPELGMVEHPLLPNAEEASLVTIIEASSTPNKTTAATGSEKAVLPTTAATESETAVLPTTNEDPAVRVIEKDWFEILRERNIVINYNTHDVKIKKKRRRHVKRNVNVDPAVPTVDNIRNLQHELARKAAMEHPLCGFLLPKYDLELPAEPVKDSVETSLPMPATDNDSFVNNIPSALKEFIMPAIETVTIAEPERAASKYTEFVMRNAEHIAFIVNNIDRWHSIMGDYDPNRFYSYYDINKLLARDPHKTEIEYELIQEIIRRPYFDIKRCSFIKTEQDVVIANNFCEDLARADIITFSESGIVSLKTY